MIYIAPPLTLWRLCYFLFSCKVAFFSLPLKEITSRNFEARTMHLFAFGSLFILRQNLVDSFSLMIQIFKKINDYEGFI